MSLANLCSITSATIQRVASTQGTAGGQVRTYSTANRGALPTTSTGRLVHNDGSRRFAYAMHDQQIDAFWETVTNPQCNNRDILIVGSETYFVQSQINPDNVGKYYELSLRNFSRELQ